MIRPLRLFGEGCSPRASAVEEPDRPGRWQSVRCREAGLEEKPAVRSDPEAPDQSRNSRGRSADVKALILM